MSDEVINHLERVIAQLKNHVTEQDKEVFRLSKLVDSLSGRVVKLEKRFSESGLSSPLEGDFNQGEKLPPHY